MNLAKALRLGPNPRLAFVGSGGKSSALFRLARELTPPVWITATTHLSREQRMLADQHIVIRSPGDLQAVVKDIPIGLTLFTGGEGQDGRQMGVEIGVLNNLLELAGQFDLPLLIEADGSRRLPLKAPAEYEPALPGSTYFDEFYGLEVVVVAGLSALGKPFTADWVHRPERFAPLAGLEMDQEITKQAIVDVLTHPLGGLKNIPVHARRIALLNQADTPMLQAQAHRMAVGGEENRGLLSNYQSVVIAALRENQIFAVHEPVGGIVLTAGGSNRFGSPKQIIPWRGEPLVRHVTREALSAGLSPVVVVTGAFPAEVSQALDNLPVILVHNPDWEAGQSTSLQAGLRALPDRCGGAVFLLVDQPYVSSSLIRKLVETHASTLSPIVAPLADGRRANPVLFDRLTFPDLLQLSGDIGGRKLFSTYQVDRFPWHDASILLDIDTPEAYQSLLAQDR